MKAVLLAGGEGTRLRPLTSTIPKAMVSIVNRPFLDHVIAHLKAHNVDEIILTLCYMPQEIKKHFGDGRGLNVKLVYAVEETPLGTAGAVKHVEHYLDGPLIVLNGDVFTDMDLTEMLAFHREKGAKVTIGLTPVDDPTSFGLVETNTKGKVRRFVEKPSWEAVTTNMVNTGCYILEPEGLKHIPERTFHMFEHGLFPTLLQLDVPVYGFPGKGYWIDIGTPENYLRVHHDILRGKLGASFPGQKVSEGVWAEEGCRIHRTAQLNGPIVLGNDCTIGPYARIMGPVVMGSGCVIGEETVVREAVLWKNVEVGSRSTLSGCIISSGCRVGNGVWVMDGSVIGDSAIIGDGNKLERGMAIWPGKTLEPGTISFMRTG